MFNRKIWTLQSFLSFVKQLLNARWRALLVLFVGVYIPLQVFGELAIVVWKNEGSFPWDEPILLAIHSSARPQLDVFAVTLTQLGAFSGMVTIVTGISLVLLSQRRWRSLVYLLITVSGSTIINRTAKVILHRVRPHLWDSLTPEMSYAFPSGHAMSSMTLVAALVIITWGSSWRWQVVIVGSLFAVSIGWTRLYLGVHFPSDILAGWLVSIAWAVGVSLLIRPNLTKANQVQAQPANETSLLPEEIQLQSKE